jgi:hypothetical protein
VLFSCVAMITLNNREPLNAELLAGDKNDALAKYVQTAEMELEGLEVINPASKIFGDLPKRRLT